LKDLVNEIHWVFWLIVFFQPLVDWLVSLGYLKSADSNRRRNFFFWHAHLAILTFGLFFLLQIWKPEGFEMVLAWVGFFVFFGTGVIIRYRTISQILKKNESRMAGK